MQRRAFITLLGGAAASWPLVAHAQQPGMPVIGYVHPGLLEGERRQVDAFYRGLKEAGFVEGQNVTSWCSTSRLRKAWDLRSRCHCSAAPTR